MEALLLAPAGLCCWISHVLLSLSASLLSLFKREAPHLGRVQLEEQPGKLGGGVGRKMTPKWCSSSSRSFGQS